MINLEHEIDFTKEKTEEPHLESFLKQAIKAVEKEQSELIAKFKKPIFDEDLENHLIVTNIPDVTGKQAKFENLFKEKVLDKKKIGAANGLQKFEFGYKIVGDAKKSNQTLYLIYKTAANAKKAFQKLHMMKFDREHQLICFTVKQFRLAEQLSDICKEPTFFSKKQKIETNLDKFNRDQFLYRLSGSDSEKLYLKWFDHVEKKLEDAISNAGDEDKTIDLKERIKGIYTSPRGSYVAICNNEGVRLFVGNDLKEKAFFPHRGACEVAFSPNENYMVTFTGAENLAKAFESIMLWSIQEEVRMYSIRSGSFQDLSSIQFNEDDSKLAIVGENEIYIHDCGSFSALKQSLKKSEDEMIEAGTLLKALNIKKVAWMPDRANLLCTCYELNPSANINPTSKIYFHNVNTKEERKWRAIGQHIKKVEITVSDNAEWAAVSFKKIQKKTQSISTIFIVNLQKREIETEVKQFHDNVVSISWDKKYGKFGVVFELNTGVKSAHTQFGVQFFQVHTKNNVIGTVELGGIASTPLNRLIMAQNDVFFALYNTSIESSGRDKYSIGYLSKDQKNKKPSVQLVKQNVQVSYMNFFFVDPSGRFVVLGTDKMFQIWSMSGQLIIKNNETLNVKNVLFRPRYLTRISSAEQKKLVEQEKELIKKYQELDEQKTNALEYQKQLEKKQRRENFKSYLQKKREWFSTYRQSLAQIRGFDEQDAKVKNAEYIYFQRQRA